LNRFEVLKKASDWSSSATPRTVELLISEKGQYPLLQHSNTPGCHMGVDKTLEHKEMTRESVPED